MILTITLTLALTLTLTLTLTLPHPHPNPNLVSENEARYFAKEEVGTTRYQTIPTSHTYASLMIYTQ